MDGSIINVIVIIIMFIPCSWWYRHHSSSRYGPSISCAVGQPNKMLLVSIIVHDITMATCKEINPVYPLVYN